MGKNIGISGSEFSEAMDDLSQIVWKTGYVTDHYRRAIIPMYEKNHRTGKSS